MKHFIAEGGVGVALAEHTQCILKCLQYILITNKQTRKISFPSERNFHPQILFSALWNDWNHLLNYDRCLITVFSIGQMGFQFG